MTDSFSACATFVAAGVALLVAFISPYIAKYANQTDLELSIESNYPDAVETLFGKQGSSIVIPTIYYRLKIQNIGKNDAENVQVYISEMKDSIGNKVANFLPMCLTWAYKNIKTCCNYKNEGFCQSRILQDTTRHCDLFFEEQGQSDLVFCVEDKMAINGVNNNVIKQIGIYTMHLKLACSNMEQTKDYEVKINYKKPWNQSLTSNLSNFVEILSCKQI